MEYAFKKKRKLNPREFSFAVFLGVKDGVRTLTSKTRTVERLHKPFKNVEAVLDEVLQFDKKLHLCCLLAYGCLLRPHREIRLLTWGDGNIAYSMLAQLTYQ